MTREEIKNKLFDIILKNSSPTIEIKRTIDYQQTMAIVAEFITHESDLLKEFVEWLKYEYAREEHFEMKEAKDCQQKEYTYLYEYHRGREAMAEKIRDMLDQDLKKFMEERK